MEFSRLTSFRPDYPTTEGVRGARGADGRLRLHQKVLDEIEPRPRISKRLAVVAQQMAALGRSTIVKGCSDPVNKGWRRTPLGGHHGMHYYLWWAPQGTRQTRRFRLQRNSLLLRAVRHHDDHRPLNAGRLQDYYTLAWTDLDGDSASIFETPWTEIQQLFALEDKPVRLVYGYPGSGKTMALWRAVEARDSGRTLYLSWSRALTEQARARFSSFAPPGAAIDALDFGTFVGQLRGADLRRQSLVASRRAFADAFDWWKISDHQGPWKNRMDALHAELRAILFGCAVPGVYECEADGARLCDAAYLKGDVSKVGPIAGKQVLELVRRSNWRGWYDNVFPELSEAGKALARLHDGSLPEGLSKYDRIVVDEVQDLTLLEAAVVVQYCRVLAARRGHAPWLLMAFDDGQTVRPSGFDSGRLNSLLHSWLTTPEEFNLEFNVRSPGPIARVIERASVLYTVIRKGARPVDQRSELSERDGAPAVDARLIYAEIRNRREARELLTALGEVDNLAMVTPEGVVPDWVPNACRNAVLTPEGSKGLEYASVCVLDLGTVLTRLRRSVYDQDPLEIHQRRTAIDRLRVALSRATENLILIDVAPDAAARGLCLELLGTAERFTASDLLELFQDADAPPDERILTRTLDAKTLIDVNSERAWERALQALRLFRGVGGRALVDDRSIQDEVCLTVLGVAARRLVEDGLDDAMRKVISQIAQDVAQAWGSREQSNAVRQLAEWTAKRTRQPLALLDAGRKLQDLDEAWLNEALPTVYHRLQTAIRDCASDAGPARRFDENVEDWLRLAGFMGNVGEEAQRLRQVAVDALAAANQFKGADRVLARMVSPKPKQVAIVSEGLGRHAQAGAAFEAAGMPQDALRNWRIAGDFEKALPLATGKTKADLQWMVKTEELMRRRPREIQDRLTVAERKRLAKAKRMPPRQRPRRVQGRRGRGSPKFVPRRGVSG